MVRDINWGIFLMSYSQFRNCGKAPEPLFAHRTGQPIRPHPKNTHKHVAEKCLHMYLTVQCFFLSLLDVISVPDSTSGTAIRCSTPWSRHYRAFQLCRHDGETKTEAFGVFNNLAYKARKHFTYGQAVTQGSALVSCVNFALLIKTCF